jgi:hypothetical protein
MVGKYCLCSHLKTMHLKNGSCLTYYVRHNCKTEHCLFADDEHFINVVKRCCCGPPIKERKYSAERLLKSLDEPIFYNSKNRIFFDSGDDTVDVSE